MSFKLKTILLILSISLIPYILLMLYAGNILRNEYYKNAQSEMQTQLQLSVGRIEQYLETLKRDMEFVVGLDTMNDIFSLDLDRRISHLLEEKKTSLKLDGDFYLLDTSGKIIASSSAKKLSKIMEADSFFTSSIHSPFDNKIIGTLVVEFSLKNLTRFFSNSDSRHYYIILDNKDVFFRPKEFKRAVHVGMNLKSKSNIQIVLEEDGEVFSKLLDKYENIFIVALIVGALLIGLISLFFTSRLVRPILKLSKVADDITQKQDYSYQVDVSSNDEIGKLSKSFNMMITGMSNALVELKNESENRIKLTQEQGKNEMLEELSSKLSKYLSPQIYESIFSGAQDVTLTSKRKKLTIFFSDIIGFTDITDKMESEDLSELLNDYLNSMTIIALEYGATVDKYIGDAMMLFFGDPKSKGIQEDAQACVNMALAMQEKMYELHKNWKVKGFTKPFQVRMGIHTGYCTVGNFGSENRLEYTIIGSSVNLASRIESAAQPNEVWISEETQLLLNSEFHCTERTQITPKGFMRPITLFSVEKYKSSDSDKGMIDEDGLSLHYELERISPERKNSLKEELSNLIEKL